MAGGYLGFEDAQERRRCYASMGFRDGEESRSTGGVDVRLGELEHALLSRHAPDRLAGPARVAFLGLGSLPLVALLLAARHMPDAAVDCFDRCGAANDRARRLLLRGRDDDGSVAPRMSFRTADVVEDLKHELAPSPSPCYVDSRRNLLPLERWDRDWGI